MTMIVWKIFFWILSLLTAATVKNSLILAGIYFIILKKCPRPNLKVFNTKFGPQGKYQGSTYQVRQVLAIFFKVVALILSLNCLKGLRVTKIIKQSKFEGAWNKLEARTVSRDNHGQQFSDKL